MSKAKLTASSPLKAVLIVIVGALSFITALAWNEMLKESTENLITGPYARFVYPIAATLVLVIGVRYGF